MTVCFVTRICVISVQKRCIKFLGDYVVLQTIVSLFSFVSMQRSLYSVNKNKVKAITTIKRQLKVLSRIELHARETSIQTDLVSMKFRPQ